PFAFFFSSRRRHTRFSRDWSADVCSSDLRRDTAVDLAWDESGRRVLMLIESADAANESVRSPRIVAVAWTTGVITPLWDRIDDRSEERRVGTQRGLGWRKVQPQQHARIAT